MNALKSRLRVAHISPHHCSMTLETYLHMNLLLLVLHTNEQIIKMMARLCVLCTLMWPQMSGLELHWNAVWTELGKMLRSRIVLTGLCQCFHVVSNKVLNTFQGIRIKDRNAIIVTILHWIHDRKHPFLGPRDKYHLSPVWYDPYDRAFWWFFLVIGIRKLAAIKKTVIWAQYGMDRKRKTGSIA